MRGGNERAVMGNLDEFVRRQYYVRNPSATLRNLQDGITASLDSLYGEIPVEDRRKILT